MACNGYNGLQYFVSRILTQGGVSNKAGRPLHLKILQTLINYNVLCTKAHMNNRMVMK